MKRLSELRVALWPDDPLALVDREISDRVSMVGQRLSKLGAKVSNTARPSFNTKEAHDTYLQLLAAATGRTDKKFVEWDRLDRRRGIFRTQWNQFFKEWDLLICPISATVAFLHDHSPIASRTLEINGVERPYFEQLFWAGLATLSYLPSTVFPTGLSEGGLPIGLQAIGDAFDDHTTIEFARLMESEFGGFRQPPGYAG